VEIVLDVFCHEKSFELQNHRVENSVRLFLTQKVEGLMAKRGRPTFESLGKPPPKTANERRRESYARMRERKGWAELTFIEALVWHKFARDALKDGCYRLMTGGVLLWLSDEQVAEVRKALEGLLEETAWAVKRLEAK
jgi:hypothetical protein